MNQTTITSFLCQTASSDSPSPMLVLIGLVFLVVSEVLPFVTNQKVNSICQGLLVVLENIFHIPLPPGFTIPRPTIPNSSQPPPPST